MKLLAAIVAALLVTVGVVNAGEIVITPKGSDGAVVLRITAGKVVEASAVDAANAGEIVIKPKASDSAVVLTISAGKLVKASVRPKPEHMARPVKDTAGLARTR
jgi:archaeosine-15-forming tRNA-guanine transglycosylase